MTAGNRPHLSVSDAHLTDEQFSDLLAAGEVADSHPHLQACAPCRAEFYRVREAVTSFSEMSLQWAETQPRIHVPTRASLFHIPAMPLWSAAAAMLVVFAVALGVHEQHTHTDLHRAAVITAPAPSSSVAEDNQMLLAIDGELRYPEQGPVVLSNEPLNQPASATTKEVTN